MPHRKAEVRPIDNEVDMTSPIDFHKSRIVELDGIRGLAALFVLIHHYYTGILKYEVDGIWWVLESGLAVFF